MKNIFRFSAVTLLTLSLLSCPLVLHAQFSDFDDGTDTGWTRYDPLGGLGAGSRGDWSASSGLYTIQALASPNPSAAGPGRAASLRDDVNYTDFYISVDLVGWRNDLNQVVGILSRGKPVWEQQTVTCFRIKCRRTTFRSTGS